jgi:two-component system, cell cycle sensor histidine kinase and response regulator CckA
MAHLVQQNFRARRQAIPVHHDVEQPMTRSRETILVVQEEEALRATVCQVLRGEGYTAIPVGHSVEAQWCVERHGAEVDLLLIDLAPPAARDYDLSIPLCALWPHTPVIFTSAQGRAESIRRGLLHPRAPFLQQPFPPYVLTRTVRAVLDRWTASPVF